MTSKFLVQATEKKGLPPTEMRKPAVNWMWGQRWRGGGGGAGVFICS